MNIAVKIGEIERASADWLVVVLIFFIHMKPVASSRAILSSVYAVIKHIFGFHRSIGTDLSQPFSLQ